MYDYICHIEKLLANLTCVDEKRCKYNEKVCEIDTLLSTINDNWFYRCPIKVQTKLPDVLQWSYHDLLLLNNLTN